jgi:diguanylate cyclase (GGDEF)-like protein/PAS domain S-box-containing protein
MVAWEGLLEQFAVLAIFITAWTQLSSIAAGRANWPAATLRTLLLAGAVLAMMAMPVVLRPGLQVDLRTAMIVLAGFFGGPISGIATWAAAMAYRFWIGGFGAPLALFGATLALMLGVAARYLMPRRPASNTAVVALGMAAAIVGISGFVVLPAEIRWATFQETAAPLVFLVFAAVVVAGVAISQDERRLATERENSIYRAVIDELPDPLNAKDRDSRFVVANPATAHLMRAASASELIGRSDFDFYPAEIAEGFRESENRVLEGKGLTLEERAAFDDGTERWLSTTKTPLRNSRGEIVGVITHNRDISVRKRLRDEKNELQRRLTDALTNMADGLAMFDRDGRIVMCNPQYAAMFPLTAHLRVPGADLADILRASIALGEEQLPGAVDVETWVATIRDGLWRKSEHEIRLAGDRWLQARVRPSPDGTSLTVVSDVTAAKRAEAALQESNARLDLLARTDALTNLNNRRSFDDAVEREYLRAVRSNAPVSVLLCDIDYFKRFNDNYGHPQGDACLKEVAACLQAALRRPADIAARYGGEEFVALLPDTDAAGALAVAETFREAVRAINIPHRGSPHRRVTVSIGVATVPGAGIDSPGQLVRKADEALYQSKATGRDCTTDAGAGDQRAAAG